MSQTTGNMIYLILLLVLIASSLAARRLPIYQLVKITLAWLLIFGCIFILFSFRAEIKQVWARVKAEAGAAPHVAANGPIQIQKSPDGHFHIAADVNGTPISFLIDSGATTTALSARDAAKAGVDTSDLAFPVIVSTANGQVQMRRARIARFAIGPIVRRDFGVLVSDQLGDTNLLGMNFLSSLRGWRIEGDVMILEH